MSKGKKPTSKNPAYKTSKTTKKPITGKGNSITTSMWRGTGKGK